jgi:toxin-antitoxin system PIN domain toxin
MTSYLVDINVWLAMTWGLHPQHSGASRWFRTIGDNSAPMFCRFTMLGFLHLLTNRVVMGDSAVTVNDALKLYDQWANDPRVQFEPESRPTDKLFREALVPVADQMATKAIADCYLIGFAGACGARILTLDKGLAGLSKSRGVLVTLIRAEAKD